MSVTLDLQNLACHNPECPAYLVVGMGNLVTGSPYGSDRTKPRYTCVLCGKSFAITRGSMFYRLHTDRETVLRTLTQLPTQGSIRATDGTFVDALLGFVDYDYDAPNDTITVSPKLPSDWNYLGSHIQIKDGDLYVKVTKGTNQRLVDLDNNSSNNLSVNIYVQTDAQPTSVTGTSLNWSYDSTTGRVRLYGTLNASASNDITINF
jgi:hypothetical protein